MFYSLTDLSVQYWPEKPMAAMYIGKKCIWYVCVLISADMSIEI